MVSPLTELEIASYIAIRSPEKRRWISRCYKDNKLSHIHREYSEFEDGVRELSVELNEILFLYKLGQNLRTFKGPDSTHNHISRRTNRFSDFGPFFGTCTFPPLPRGGMKTPHKTTTLALLTAKKELIIAS